VPTEILVSSDPWENRVAILEDGELAEIYIEREEKVIGSIYKGKVQNVLPGMGASFVDIGLGRNAFLYVDDINKAPLNIGDVEVTQGRTGYSITEKVSRNDDVLVQIVKEPRGLKGARVSTNISLPGRYLILMPQGKFSGVSRKIASATERDRLKNIMKLIRPEGMATVVRTAAGNVSQAELIADLGVLIRMWHGILETYKRAQAPALVHKDMNLVYKAARDFITPEVDRVLMDDPLEFEKVRDFMRLLGPQYVERIKLHDGGRKLFADFGIDDAVTKLLRPKVNLPSGGSIVIETTEALTVIDVNSGKFTGGKNLEDTIVRTNVEAAAEIARQVRLRDIGGIIVCDFIDMGSETSRNKVVATLEAGLARDRTRNTIQSFSSLGLLEFTRKRVGKDLSGQLRGACPTCVGLGTVMSPESVAIETFRTLRGMGRDHAPEQAIEVRAAATVGAQLAYWYEDEMAALETELGTTVALRVDPTIHPERTAIGRIDAATAKAPPSVRVGDELEAELIRTRLPNAASALAVVDGRLIEVENAANATGETIKIKVIDVDDDGTVLAEPRSGVDLQAATGEHRRRRRGGRGRGSAATPAEQTEEQSEEQTEELRELAEEAAKGLGGRSSIALTSTPDALGAPDAATRALVGNALPLATVTPLRTTSDLAEAESAGETDVRKRRRRRRRRRGGESGAPVGVDRLEAADASAEAEFADGEPAADRGEDASEESVESDDLEANAASGDEGEGEETLGADGLPTRRRRRRRRRGRGGAPGSGETETTGDAGAAPLRPAPPQVAATPPAAVPAAAPSPYGRLPGERLSGTGAAAPESRPQSAPRPFDPEAARRRGAPPNGRPAAPGAPAPRRAPAVDPQERRAAAERAIFRAGTGGVEHTGETAPPEPVRALAPREERTAHVAVEAPPPALTAPPEPPRRATPARPRRGSAPASGPNPQLESPVRRALPPGAPEVTAEPAASEAAPPGAEPPVAAEPAPRRRAPRTRTTEASGESAATPEVTEASIAAAPVVAPTARRSRMSPVAASVPEAPPVPEAPAPEASGADAEAPAVAPRRRVPARRKADAPEPQAPPELAAAEPEPAAPEPTPGIETTDAPATKGRKTPVRKTAATTRKKSTRPA